MSERGVSLRASTVDRERVVGELRRHLLDGRIGAEEFEQRIESAYSAATLEELAALTRDLPAEDARNAPTRTRRLLLPGNRPFAVRFQATKSPTVVVSEAMRSVAPSLLRARYRLEGSDPTRLVFRREQYPFWNVAAAIFIPFLGLVLLFAAGREKSEIVVSATEVGPGHTIVDVFGVASLRIRRSLLELEH